MNLTFFLISFRTEIPFVIYGDFETILVEENVELSEKTLLYQKHIPCGFSCVVIDMNGEVLYDKFYRGENCVKKFLKILYELSSELSLTLNKISPMAELTEEEEYLYEKTTICHICEKEITKFDIKVKDHCHIFSNFRGASHLVI